MLETHPFSTRGVGCALFRIAAGWRLPVLAVAGLVFAAVAAQAQPAHEASVVSISDLISVQQASTGLAQDATGAIYWSDSYYVYRYAPTDAYPTNYATLINGNSQAAQLTMAPGGLIYYATTTYTIQRLLPSGALTQLAGVAGQSGYRDGPGAQALFADPQGLVADAAGTLFVADRANHVIRKITTDGMVSTLAGRAGFDGSADGVGDTARFRWPSRLALDAAGNLYVSEQGNSAIRRITPQGVVTTFAGSKTQSGTVDGPATVARFYPNAGGLIVADDGYLYVMESNRAVRRVAPDGTVVTVAGLANASAGYVDGVGSFARFSQPSMLARAVDGTLLVGDGNRIRRIVPAGRPFAPLIAVPPQSQSGALGGSVTFTVTAYGLPAPTYSWRKNGTVLPGAGGPSLTLAGLAAADAADYSVVVTNNLGSTTSATATLTLVPPPANDAFAARATLTGTTPSASVSFIGATRESGEPAHQPAGTGSLWWTWTAPATGFVTLDATMAASGTGLKVYTGNALDALAPVAPAPAYAHSNGVARVTFAATAGTAYQIALESAGTPPSGLASLSLGYAYVVAAIAGNSTEWYGGGGTTDGTGTEARFQTAAGIVRDSNGNFFITDFSAHTIRRMTPAGVVTTFAGTAGTYNYANGTGAAAAFRQPQGIAIDASNNLYVADSWNHSIRKITPAGAVSLLAGGAGETNSGFTNASGASARFNFPTAVAVDTSGNVYVADSGNHVIRRVTAAGAVSTYAGSGTAGLLDGTGTAAQLSSPSSIAIRGTTLYFTQSGSSYAILRAINLSNAAVTTVVPESGRLPYSARVAAIDAAGNAYLVDPNYYTSIYRVSPQGVVSRIVGNPYSSQTYVDGDGLLANSPGSFGLTLDPSENLWFTAQRSVRRAQPTNLAIAPMLNTAPAGAVVAEGTAHTLSVRAYGGPTMAYQWSKDGTPIPGATEPDLVFSPAQMADSASYSVTVSNASGTLTPPAVSVFVVPVPANDAFASADELTGASASSTSYNYGATRESGEPILHASAGGRTLWWKWTAPHDGVIVADTAGSEILNFLGAYQGASPGALTSLGVASSGAYQNPSLGLIGDAARLHLNVLAGQTYHFVVDAQQAAQGILRLNVAYALTATNFAGTTSASGSTDGTGDAARFSGPGPLTRDAAGNLYVFDNNNRTIRKITPAGVVTTLAGATGQLGSTDGTGSDARFTSLAGFAVDPSGNLYAVDQSTHVIRKITPAGVVTTLAGTAGTIGSSDGTGAAALFNSPRGIAYGSDGHLYVVDSGNHTIRRVTLAGVVTTFAGTAGQPEYLDATGAAARFSSPRALAASADGQLYVYDTNVRRIRRIDLATAAVTTFAGSPYYSVPVDGIGQGVGYGVVNALAADANGNVFFSDGNRVVRRLTSEGRATTLVGLAGSSGLAIGTGPDARFISPQGIALASDGTLYVADSGLHVIRRLAPSYEPQAPVIQTVPANQVVLGGTAVTFTVGYLGAPAPQFAWRRDGNLVATTNTGTLTIPSVQVSDAGTYTVELTNSAGTALSGSWTLGVTPQAVNDAFADRIVLTGENVQTTGNNFSATSEAGEPVHFEAESNRSVWWSWTAPASGYFMVDTIGSSFDAMIAVYTGSALPHLVSLGSGLFRLSFTAVAGTTYHLAVDGRAGATGAIALRIQPAYVASPFLSTTGVPPSSVAQDSSGNVWFTSSDHTVRRISAAGEMTIVAGAATVSGSTDAVGAAARFNNPRGIARAADGTLYVSDSGNHTIRRIATDGTVTTLAGTAGQASFVNGTGSVARFNTPQGLTLDAAGENLYIAEANRRIRKLALATGEVTTFSGSGSSPTSSIHDGSALGARYSNPTDITLAADGFFYVADSGMRAVRKVAPDGSVTTFAGTRFNNGSTDGAVGVARFESLQNIVAEPSGSLLVTDLHAVRRITTTGEVITVLGGVNEAGQSDGVFDEARFRNLRGIVFGASGGYVADTNNARMVRINAGTTPFAPRIASGPSSRTAYTGDSVTLSVSAIGVPVDFTYAWTRNNVAIPNSNTPTLTLANLATTATGDYRVTVTNTAGSVESAPATLTVNERPANDAFASAVTLTGAAPSFIGTNAGATREAGEPVIASVPGGASVWFRWTAPASGAVIADTAGSSVNTLLAVHTGNALQDLALVVQGQTPVPTGATIRSNAVMFTAVEGTTYWIAVDGEYGATGDIVLHLSFTYNFSTLAGLAGTSGNTNGVGTAARFNRLNASAPDNLGNVYVADLNNHTIRKVAADGTVTTFAGSPGSAAYTNSTGTSARFNNPAGIVVGPDGNIYVADASNHAIRRITPAGAVSTFAGPTSAASGTTDATGTSARFNGPVALVFDAAGNLYVAEFGNHAVRKITPGGAVTTVAGLKGTSGAVDATGTAARFNSPEGIAVDSAGNLYVADFNNYAVRKIAPDGAVTTLAGQLGSGGYIDGAATAARFNRPNGVTALPDGSILVADYYNSALRQITPAGYVLTLAGGNGNGHVNGTGLGLKFNGPSQIAFDANGRLYVADQSNHVLRRGIITSAPSAPDITRQPQSVRLIAGSTFTLTAGAIGNPFPTYQWRRNGSPIAGATAATFSLADAQPADSGSYTVVATNANGTATSEAATVEILPLPANDSFGTRARILGGEFTLSTYNYAATAQTGEPAHGGAPAARSVWFTWTAPASGDVYLDTIGSTFDTRLALYDGDTLGTLRLIGENTSEPGAKFSKLRFTIAAGSTVHIAVDGVAGATGDFKLSLGYNFAFQLHAGASNTAGSTNGTLTQARFNAPIAMASDAAGNLYIADSENHVIRRITPAGAVTTFAGTAGSSGSANGTGAAARFNRPFGIVADKLGNLFVADTSNHTIRKIVISTAAVSTLAGTAASTGTTDGTGAAARFNTPVNLAVDAANNLYVSDYSNRTIRKITQAGVVTTFAGTAGTVGNLPRYFNTPWGLAVDAAGNVYVSDSADIRKITPEGVASYFVGHQNGDIGYADGAGSAARFNRPSQLTIDSAGNLYVADQLNHVIRQVTPAGEVRTLGGHPGEAAHLNGTAGDAYFAHPTGIVMDAGGYLYVGSASMHIVTVGLRQAGPRAPFVSTQPADQSVAAGGTASFVVVAAGQPAPTYQWRKNGTNLPGATSPLLSLANVSAADVANYDVVVTNANGTVTSRAAALTLAAAPANDAFAAAATLMGLSASATAFPSVASAEAGEPAHAGAAAARSLWWAWTAPANGTVIVETTGSTVDTRLAAYTGGALGSLALVAENDDTTAGGGSRVQFVAVAGTTYRFAVDVNGAGNGAVRLALDYAYVVSTFAGTSGLSGTANGTGTAASFNLPYRVAADSLGNLYVADTGNHVIRKITPAGAVTTFAGSPGQAGTADGNAATARFNSPAGIALDALDTLYVADAGNHTIRKITSAGVVTTIAGLAGTAGSADGSGTAARFSTPVDLAVDPVTNGGSTLLVADFGNHTIRRVTNTGAVTTLAGSAGQTGFADGTGSAARFNAPRGVAVDSSAVIYVADTDNHTLRRITSAGVVTTLAGFPGSAGILDGDSATARFSSPMDLAVDASGRLLITQIGGGAIRRRAADGTVTTVAGGITGGADGTSFAARFSTPFGVALKSDGTAFVADVNNHLVRQLTPANLTAAPQTITFAAPPDVPFGAAPITLNATSSSGLAVVFEVVAGEASVSGNQLTLLGTGTVTIRATQPGNASWLPAEPVLRSFTVTAGFAAWLVENFTPAEIENPALTGPNADFDRDGFSNLVEYALGLDPRVASNADVPTVAASASEWTFTYTRPADRSNVTYTVQASTNLTTWTDVAATRTVTGPTETWRATVPVTGNPNLIFRLKIVQSSPQ